MANPIYVTYTPTTTGSHRICYRQTIPVADLAFCCILDNTLSTPGTPKMFTIVDAGITPCSSGVSPSDPPGTYNGYVQPTCAPDDGVSFATVWAAPVVIP
jgi:hypothetical protein